MASQLAHKPAWELVGLVDPPQVWLDWTIEMSQKYPVGSLKFERAGDAASKVAFQQRMTGWDDVLAGEALRKFRAKFIPKLPPSRPAVIKR